MILAIDAGNTNIVLGAFDGENILFRERLSTRQTATDLEYASGIRTALDMHGIDRSQVTEAILSSVVPAVTDVLRRAVEKCLGASVMTVGPGMKTGLRIMIDNPAQLGSDLVVDAVAGISEYPLPLIIIDMGTATTLSVIDRNKAYLGGAIMTGMAVSAEALSSQAALLQKISFEAPKRIIGRNTVECMRSGMMFSNAHALDGMIAHMEKELGESCTVVATGGLAGVVIPLCQRHIILDEDLLLKGLRVLYLKNRSS